MRQTLRRFISVLPLLAVLALPQTAWAQQEVYYWHHAWDYSYDQGKYRVSNFRSPCTNYKVLDASTSLSASKDFGVGDNPEWDKGGYKWVVVKGNVTINTLSVIGEGHLILTDGCKLTCTGGVWLSGSSTLNIYGQSSDGRAETEGQLIVTQSNKSCAGIGSWKQEEANGSPVSMGSLTIHGGHIEATGAKYGAGIGGGEDRGIQSGCTYTQYGGDVRAIGGEYAAGLGGGYAGHQGGEVKVYGGKLYAKGGEDGAGIGGGGRGDGGHVHVYGSGADVTALGGKNGAGIGGGNSGNGSNWANRALLTVDGGKVTATGGEDGAGIGGGWGKYPFGSNYHNNGGLVTVNGGEVTAQGGKDAAGIGSGGNYYLTSSGEDYGDLIVNGGKVKATGGDHGAGIGGGCGSYYHYENPCRFEITGGEVIAQGGIDAAGIGGGTAGIVHHVLIKGGTVWAAGGPKKNNGNGVYGIGGGVTCYVTDRKNAVIDIQGGNVTAIGKDKRGGIGGTDGMFFMGGTIISTSELGKAIECVASVIKLHIGEGMRVSNGDSESDLALVEAGKRVDACYSDKHVAKLEPCDHTAFGNYTYIDDNRHTAHCRYCAYSKEQAHEYTDGKCACGKEKEVKPETVSITLYHAKDATSGEYDNGLLLHVVKGEKYTIPTNNAPEGLTFMGWMEVKDPSKAPADYEMRDGDFTTLVDAGEELTPTTDINLYARYRYQYTDEWTWSDDLSTATVTIKKGDQTIVENQPAAVYPNSLEPTAENPDGTINKTATYAWTKGDGIVYNFSDIVSRPVSLALTLSDDSDNSALLEQAVGTTYQTVTLSGRTLYKDGAWNTLCLPFDVTIEDSPLSGDGVVAQVLNAEKSSLSDDGHLSLTFADAPATIPAGTPFIIKWNNTGKDLTNPQFKNVTVTAPQPASAGFRGGSFVGQFSPFQITSSNLNAIVLLTGDNTLGYSQNPRTLRSCRAHFEVLREMTAGARLMTGYSITFGPSAEADPTAVRSVTVGGDDNDGWYTLGGQRLSSRPTRQGIYVRQGRKVVIK